jgi:hypothetical protein
MQSNTRTSGRDASAEDGRQTLEITTKGFLGPDHLLSNCLTPSLLLLLLLQVEVVPEALYWYRTNSGSMIRNKLYSVTKALPMRSFLRYGDQALAPAILVAAQQAVEAILAEPAGAP